MWYIIILGHQASIFGNLRVGMKMVLGIPMNGEWHVKFNSSWKGYDQVFEGTEIPSVTANGPFEKDTIPISV
jgi:hypothetical protein